MQTNDKGISPGPPGRPVKSRSGASLPGILAFVVLVLLVAGVILVVIFTFKSIPGSNEQIAAWSTSGARQKMAEPPGWETVLDDTRILRKPYFHLLSQTDATTAEQMQSTAAVDFAFTDLVVRPQQFRGKLLRVEGQVIDVRPVYPERDPSELEGAQTEQLPPFSIYQMEIVRLKDGSVAEKYFLHAIAFPEHLSPGDKVVFRGYFYNLYKGKEVMQKEGVKAVVVAPLLVGRMIEPSGGKQYARESIPADLLAGVEDHTEIAKSDETAILTAVEALKSVKGASDVTYFDLCAAPEKFRGCVVRITGEVSRIETLENKDVPNDMKKYRRVVLTVGKDTPFARYAAAYLPPDVPEVKEMQVVTLRGVFIKTAEMEGGRDKLAYLPLIASNEAESVTWAKTPEMNRWLRFLLVGVIVFAALLMLVAAVIFYMVRKDKAAELKHRQALRDITSKLKEGQ